MKLDRNTNRGGRGKYALVNIRKLIPTWDKVEAWDGEKKRTPSDPTDDELAIVFAFRTLLKAGIISLGNETPGDQFFVMKYKDQFTWPALAAYSEAAHEESNRVRDTDQKASLREYALQIQNEAVMARQLGNRIPD